MAFALQTPASLVNWAQSALILGVALAGALVVRTLLLRWLRRFAVDPQSAGRILLDALRFPSLLWCAIVALAITLEMVKLPGNAARWASAGAVVFLVLSMSVVCSTLLVRLAVHQAARRGPAIAVSGVSRALIHVFLLLLGGTVLLRYFDLSITPILTALGVGGLAVALALQDTLANFFAGIHILVEAPISVGDFIRLSAGEEGTVSDIGWRTTRVLTTAGNTIVIPNVKITSGILTNYALPDQKLCIEVVLVAGLDADVQRASQAAMEEARLVEGVMPDFAPLVLFDPGVTPTHIQFKLIVRVGHRLEMGRVQSRIRLQVLERFRREGIPLPSAGQAALHKP